MNIHRGGSSRLIAITKFLRIQLGDPRGEFKIHGERAKASFITRFHEVLTGQIHSLAPSPPHTHPLPSLKMAAAAPPGERLARRAAGPGAARCKWRGGGRQGWGEAGGAAMEHITTPKVRVRGCGPLASAASQPWVPLPGSLQGCGALPGRWVPGALPLSSGKGV